jgi:hypothetical protein
MPPILPLIRGKLIVSFKRGEGRRHRGRSVPIAPTGRIRMG